LVVLGSLFYGKTRQRLEFEDAKAPEPLRIKEEPFSYLLVDVSEEGKDLYDGLDASFQEAQVEIDGFSARRSVAVVDLPPILQIQLQVRIQRENGTEIGNLTEKFGYANSAYNMIGLLHGSSSPMRIWSLGQPSAWIATSSRILTIWRLMSGVNEHGRRGQSWILFKLDGRS
jgi:hypothetical protein